MATIKKYTKKDGSTAYMFNAYLGVDPTTGKKKYTTKRGFPTRKEAQLTLSRLQVEIEEHGFKKQSVNTFAEMYELWLESVYIHKVKESTLVKTKELFQNHILPAFGSYRIDKITIKQCQRVVNDWSKTLQKYRTMKNYTSNVLDYAVTIEALRDNPMKKISVPRLMEKVHEDKFENFYSKEELQHFLKCIHDELSFKWYALFRLLAFTGFRKGESLALEWKDVDFKKRL
ncbi:site-specific integrase [Jeotgalibaca sp. MA1X17-3]|uniref:tyrosine-type recombinase/integrase n=1 Tax=Jeotgalibaca sp. MA1X17-3 TaxID=2908211 RepID=UPI001F16B7A7|nr:site-specific integrase [Jeotgalibaca sp. MA1X17-3]UJF15013.1 site-specific integrase [Jeotgalibaca sp. MA1X17-3]